MSAAAVPAPHRLKRVIDDLLDPAIDLQATLDRHFAPDFRQTVNGQAIDRAAFMAGIASLRAQLSGATVTALDELSDGERYAERHRLALTFRDGSRQAREVYVFATLDAERRFRVIEEASRELG